MSQWEAFWQNTSLSRTLTNKSPSKPPVTPRLYLIEQGGNSCAFLRIPCIETSEPPATWPRRVCPPEHRSVTWSIFRVIFIHSWLCALQPPHAAGEQRSSSCVYQQLHFGSVAPAAASWRHQCCQHQMCCGLWTPLFQKPLNECWSGAANTDFTIPVPFIII